MILKGVAMGLLLAFAARGSGLAPFAAQDLWALKRVGPPRLSRDGHFAVLPVDGSLWVADVRRGTTRRLTSGRTDHGAAWSPDGKTIAFVGRRDRDKADSLYCVPAAGGSVAKVLELPFGIGTPAWLPDGKAMVFATQAIPRLCGTWSQGDRAAMQAELKRIEARKDGPKASEDRFYRYWDTWVTDGFADRLLRLDLDSGTLRDLTPHYDRRFNLEGAPRFDVSPDGHGIAIELDSTPPPYRTYPNTDIYLISADRAAPMRNLTPDNPHGDSDPRFSHDGRSILFGRKVHEVYAGESTKLFRHDLGTGKNGPVAAGLDLSFIQWTESADGRAIYFEAEKGGITAIFRMDLANSVVTQIVGQGTAGPFEIAPDGTLVCLHDDLCHPPEVCVSMAGDNRFRSLTHFNDLAISRFGFARPQSYTFRGADGDAVQLWLLPPPDWKPGKTYPLLQILHGGPHMMAGDAWDWRWNSQIFAGKGYFVSWINFHGSTGFGERFARSIIDEWGAKPFEDLQRGTDFLLERLGQIDRRRVAAAGFSYGGYLIAYALGHTDRFACLVDHAGANDINLQYGSDIPWVFGMTFGGQPWNHPERMRRNNPMNYAANFKTPTLITQGELDYRVPVGSGLELYGVLQAMAVPARLVIYPAEHHWILAKPDSVDWYGQVLEWLDRYLKPRD